MSESASVTRLTHSPAPTAPIGLGIRRYDHLASAQSQMSALDSAPTSDLQPANHHYDYFHRCCAASGSPALHLRGPRARPSAATYPGIRAEPRVPREPDTRLMNLNAIQCDRGRRGAAHNHSNSFPRHTPLGPITRGCGGCGI